MILQKAETIYKLSDTIFPNFDDEISFHKNNVHGYTELEQSEKKLLLRGQKCENILNVANGNTIVDYSYPISIELHLTNRCNLACQWCVDKNIRKNKLSLPYETALRFLNDISGKNIGLTIEGGGEPTIYPHFKDFILEAKNRNIDLGLISNGVLLIDAGLIPCFKWIRVSVDAATPVEYQLEKGMDCFEQVMENIEMLCRNKRQCYIGAGYVLTKRNRKNLFEFIRRLDKMQVDYVQIRSVEEFEAVSLSKEELSEINTGLKELSSRLSIKIGFNLNFQKTDNNLGLPCIAHSIRSIIHADGNVFLCEKRRHEPLVIGNIKEECFLDIWKSKKRCDYSRNLLSSESQKGCTICRITKFNKMFYELMDLKTKNFI